MITGAEVLRSVRASCGDPQPTRLLDIRANAIEVRAIPRPEIHRLDAMCCKQSNILRCEMENAENAQD